MSLATSTRDGLTEPLRNGIPHWASGRILWRGLGKHVLDIAEGIAGLGHDILLLYSQSRVDHGFQERLDRRTEYGYTAVPIHMNRQPGFEDARAVVELRRAVRGFGNLDVLHGHSSKGGALARIARWGITRGVVYTPNAWYTMNPELGPLGRFTYGLIERVLAVMTERIIVTSAEEHEHARWLGISQRKLVEIANGIHLWSWSAITDTRCRVRQQYGIADEAIVVGFLGRLVRQKAPDLAVRVFAELRRQRDDIVIIMAGDGPGSGRTRALAHELGVDSDIIWVSGVQGHEIIPAFDIFLMTSLYEGFPYALIEALNCGCAAVTTRVGGARACVHEGVNGYVIDDHTTGSLVAALLRVIEMMAKRTEIRKTARRIAEDFSCETMVERTLSVYERVAAR